MDSQASSTPLYGIVPAAVVGGVINALINGGLGWAMVPAGERLMLWAVPGLAFDVVAMSFGIAFGTGIAVTPLLRRQQRAGAVRAPEVSPFWREGFARWPAGVLHRAFNLGALSALVFAPPTIALLWLAGADGLGREAVTAFKGAFGFAHGAFVTPVIGLGALYGPGGPEKKLENMR
jgi:hypothetical protein